MYNQIYGKLSLGTGSWLSKKNFKKPNQDIFGSKVIDTYKTQILQDLLRMNIENKINKMSVMDVGTGRQALAFEQLGAKKVDLYDISKSNFLRFKKYKKKEKTKINCYNFDICSNAFLKIKKKYDLIYLHGIIQHTSDPQKAIINLKKKLNPNGIIWLYFYNLGSPISIYIDTAKRILGKKKISHKIIYNYFNKSFDTKTLDAVIDTACCDYAHINPSSYYLKLMTNLGFKMTYSKDIYMSQLPSIRVSTPSCLSSFKIAKYNKNLKSNFKTYDVLDSKLYSREDTPLIDDLYSMRKKIDYLLKKINKRSAILKSSKILFKNIYEKKQNLLKPYDEKCVELKVAFNKIIYLLEKINNHRK